jgi:hypothetical protein
MTPRRKTARPRPGIRTATEEQHAADMAVRAAASRSAAITVCDAAITAGCAGPGCQHRHSDHVTGIIRVLRVLGLIPDPQAGHPGKYAWGQARTPKGAGK